MVCLEFEFIKDATVQGLSDNNYPSRKAIQSAYLSRQAIQTAESAERYVTILP